jgi:hypothetical protein
MVVPLLDRVLTAPVRTSGASFALLRRRRADNDTGFAPVMYSPVCMMAIAASALIRAAPLHRQPWCLSREPPLTVQLTDGGA